jgi:hypothetical protein
MNLAELNYQIYNKKLLAIVKSLQQWRADLARTNTIVRVWTNHKALKYFMTTKQLNQRQARWAKVLAEFYFLIVYRPGFKNVLADTLSCHKQDIGRQEALGKAYYTQVLLTPDKLDLEIVCRLPINLASIDSFKAFVVLTDGHVPFDLINHIFTANKQLPSLADERVKAIKGDQDWKIQDACLLYKGRLVVLKNNNLRTKLLWFIYAALNTAYLGKTKTFQLITPRYY